MKKIIYTLLAALMMASCSSDEFDRLFGNDKITEGKVLIDFSVMTSEVPVSVTRAGIDDSEGVTSMKVVVYDENGIYVEQTDATLNPSSKTSGQWQAYLSLSDKPRYIHFLANYTEEIPYGTESESQTIAKLPANDEVYWQRVKLDEISAELVGEGAGQHLQVTEETAQNLRNIKLIRNFAKITIQAAPKAESKFQLLSAAIYRMPSKGTLAPYSSENSKFVEGYEDYDDPDVLVNDGYEANVPAECEMIADATDLVDVDANGKVTFNVFERDIPKSDPAFLIVKGMYNGDPNPSYFRINLRKANGKYFPVLRNFEYEFTITNINTTGASNIQDAIASAGSGDISTDLRYRNLTNISNGEARIFVDRTEVVLVTGDKVEIKYSFIPDLGNTSDVRNEDVEVLLGESEGGAVFSDMTKISVQSSVKDAQNFSVIQLMPNEPDEKTKKQTVILRGHYDITKGEDDEAVTETHYITREVTFTLRKKPSLTLECIGSNEVAAEKGTAFGMNIGIPGGLPQSMFPLNLAIEARELTISPNTFVADNHMPNLTGKSLFNSGRPGFQFVKTVSYSDYLAKSINGEGYKTFPVYFKTNTALSATDIVVANEYFNPGLTYITNGGAKTFSFDYFDLKPQVNDHALLTFYMQTTDQVTVRLQNLRPSGKSASALTYVSEEVDGTKIYTYNPSQVGVQEITLEFIDSGANYLARVEATNYTTASKGVMGIGKPDDWYTKSDYTTGLALVPGFETTITARISFSSMEGRSVKFKVNGQEISGVFSKSEGNYDYYTCQYRVPYTHNSAGVNVEVTAKDANGSSTADFGNMLVWRPKLTVGDTPLTTAANLNDRTTQEGVVEDGKRVWKGIVLKDKQYGGYIQRGTNALRIDKNASDLASNINYCFQSNGSDYLRTYDGMYFKFNKTAAKQNEYFLFDNNNNEGDLYQPRFEKIDGDNTWYIHNTGQSGYRLRNNNGTLAQSRNGTSAENRWLAYPVTVEYIPY